MVKRPDVLNANIRGVSLPYVSLTTQQKRQLYAQKSAHNRCKVWRPTFKAWFYGQINPLFFTKLPAEQPSRAFYDTYRFVSPKPVQIQNSPIPTEILTLCKKPSSFGLITVRTETLAIKGPIVRAKSSYSQAMLNNELPAELQSTLTFSEDCLSLFKRR